MIPARLHRTLERRGGQIAINLLALNGGKPYIDARLSRFPAESTLAWGGSQGETYKSKFPPLTGSSFGNKTGRRDRAYNVNHIARIIGKINQYVFARAPERDGVDEDFARDVTLSQMGINRYWRRVSSLMSAARWCWVAVDAPEPPIDPATGQPLILSVAQKRESGIRPYWSIYTPNEVVDWAFDGQGRLLWLLSEHSEYANGDPEAEAVESTFRVLWEPGRVRKFILDDDGKEVDSVVEAANPPATVPFVLVGEINDCPHWVDDAELMQRAILDLSSANHEALYKQVYAQLVMAASAAQNAAQALNVEVSQAVDQIVGAAYPIFEEADEKGISRYLIPTAADLAILRADINNVKSDLFDFVGMSLKPDSRQVESAEAKAWDHLDVAAFLRQQSQDLQEAETRLIELTREVDPSFPEYAPEYAMDFDVGDFGEEVKAYIGLANLPMPTEAGREISLGALRKARARGFLKLTDDEWEVLEAGFDDFGVEDLSALMPGNAGAFAGAGTEI